MLDLIGVGWLAPIRSPSVLLSAGGAPPGTRAAACVNSGVPTKAGAAGIGQCACGTAGGDGSNVCTATVGPMRLVQPGMPNGVRSRSARSRLSATRRAPIPGVMVKAVSIDRPVTTDVFCVRADTDKAPLGQFVASTAVTMP